MGLLSRLTVGGYLKISGKKYDGKKLLIYLFIITLGFIVIYPLFWMFPEVYCRRDYRWWCQRVIDLSP
jgi:hypothetical protein